MVRPVKITDDRVLSVRWRLLLFNVEVETEVETHMETEVETEGETEGDTEECLCESC